MYFVRKPPRPTWHGSDNNLFDKYLAFVRKMDEERSSKKPIALQQEISSLDDELKATLRDIHYYGERTANTVRRIEELRKSIPQVSDTQLIEQYYQLIDLPEVIGVRMGVAGDLIIKIRPVHPQGMDLGDFEIDFNIFSAHGPTLHRVRSPYYADQVRYLFGWSDKRYYGNYEMEVFHPYIDSTFLDECMMYFDFVGVVGIVSRELAKASVPYGYDTEKDVIADPGWSSYISEPLHSLRVYASLCSNSGVYQKIQSYEMSVREYTAYLEAKRARLGPLRVKLREARAELYRLERMTVEDRIDVEEVRKELLFITTSIPGFMGMRFREDGVPYVHLRCSFEYGGARYDLGDYEVHFQRSTSSAGVLQTALTRQMMGGYGSPYWSDYSERLGELHPSSWFCFGTRSTQITELFESGNYGHMMNVFMASLCSINPGDIRRVTMNATRIPMEEVWRNRPRMRPRRRPAQLAA